MFLPKKTFHPQILSSGSFAALLSNIISFKTPEWPLFESVIVKSVATLLRCALRGQSTTNFAKSKKSPKSRDECIKLSIDLKLQFIY